MLQYVLYLFFINYGFIIYSGGGFMQQSSTKHNITNLNLKYKSSTIKSNLEIFMKCIFILIVTVIGNLFPVWVGLFLIQFYNRKFPGLCILYKHGDLLVCSASLLTSTMLMKTHKLIMVISCASFLILGILYSGVYTYDNFSGSSVINMNMLMIWSIIIFSLSCLSFLITSIHEKKITNFDPKVTEEVNSNKLKDDFDRLNKE